MEIDTVTEELTELHGPYPIIDMPKLQKWLGREIALLKESKTPIEFIEKSIFDSNNPHISIAEEHFEHSVHHLLEGLEHALNAAVKFENPPVALYELYETVASLESAAEEYVESLDETSSK
jgi:hypothetical protein